MAEDREILREVWQGRIPVAFSLSQDDVHTMGQPDPYHLMLPRLSYVTVIFDKVIQENYMTHFELILPSYSFIYIRKYWCLGKKAFLEICTP